MCDMLYVIYYMLYVVYYILYIRVGLGSVHSVSTWSVLSTRPRRQTSERVPFIPMPMPETVCIIHLKYNEWGTVGGLYNFFGQGCGYKYHGSLAWV